MSEASSQDDGLESVDANIGRRLRLRRRELDLTLQDVAGRVGVGFQQVQKYERGLHRISASMLVRLAAALDVGVDYFYADLTRVGAPAQTQAA